MIITDKAQIKVAELKESNNLRLSGSDELECYELIESDLKLPADATFTRSSVAYKSDGTQVAANTPRFEPGKFGKAWFGEEGTTNYFGSYANTFDSEQVVFYPHELATGKTWNDCWDSNEKAYHGGHNVTMYRLLAKLSIGSALVQDTEFTLSWEQKGYLWSIVIAYSADGSKWTEWNKDTAYTVTGYYNCELDYWEGTRQLHVKVDGKKLTSSDPINYWKRIGFTFKVPAGTRYIRIQFDWYNAYNTYPAGGWVRNFQLEQKPYPTSFIDGTRSPETLTIPTAEVLNPQEGTISVWVYVNDYLKTDYGTTKQIFWWSSAIGRISLGRNVGRSWYAVTGNGTNQSMVSISDTLSVGWHLFTMRWSAAELALLIDGGAQKATAPNPYLPSNVSGSASIGHMGSSGYVNTLIDDLRISSRARTDEEILAAYQSGQPLPVDEWTTYKLDFDDKVRITTQGQIICNELIEI